MKSSQPFSLRLLASIFILSLLLFMALRWDASSFLRNQIDNAAKQAGYTLTYHHVSLSGVGIMLKSVAIQQGNQASIKLDQLQLSPVLSQLLSGTLALNIQATWLGNPIHVSIAQDGDAVRLSNIDATIDARHLKALKIPAQLSGLIHLQGTLDVKQNTGQPVLGALTLTWKQAKAGLGSPEFTLGDYTLDLNSQEDTTQPWQWSISGGSGVSLHGSGTLLPNYPEPQKWAVSGLVDTKINNDNPTLAMMMQGMMGSTQAKFRISGSLGTPRTDIIR